eukprot:gene9247-biopygen2902
MRAQCDTCDTHGTHCQLCGQLNNRTQRGLSPKFGAMGPAGREHEPCRVSRVMCTAGCLGSWVSRWGRQGKGQLEVGGARTEVRRRRRAEDHVRAGD